jgi:hypothetical protein
MRAGPRRQHDTAALARPLPFTHPKCYQEEPFFNELLLSRRHHATYLIRVSEQGNEATFRGL